MAASALLAGPVAIAQQRVPRIGFLFSFIPAQGEHLWRACRQGLSELGYVEERTIRLEPRWAQGEHDRLPGLVAELVRAKIDVIVSAATPASLAAKAGAGTTPIVFVAVADPVRTGLVASLARPGGNITGLTLLTPELSAKRLQLLVEILGPIARAAILINPDNASHLVFADETLNAARQMQIQVHSLYARDPSQIDRAFHEAVKAGAQGIVVFDDPVTWSHRRQVAELAAKHKLPAVYGYSEFTDEGGLLSYGPYRPDLYRRTAAFVDRILRGVPPADIPVERPTRFELFVNLNAARTLGRKIPSPLLLRADKVID